MEDRSRSQSISASNQDPDNLRPISAPPTTSIANFAFQDNFSSVFTSDIRCDPHYEDFYNQKMAENANPSDLPRPLESPWQNMYTAYLTQKLDASLDTRVLPLKEVLSPRTPTPLSELLNSPRTPCDNVWDELREITSPSKSLSRSASADNTLFPPVANASPLLPDTAPLSSYPPDQLFRHSQQPFSMHPPSAFGIPTTQIVNPTPHHHHHFQAPPSSSSIPSEPEYVVVNPNIRNPQQPSSEKASTDPALLPSPMSLTLPMSQYQSQNRPATTQHILSQSASPPKSKTQIDALAQSPGQSPPQSQTKLAFNPFSLQNMIQSQQQVSSPSSLFPNVSSSSPPPPPPPVARSPGPPPGMQSPGIRSPIPPNSPLHTPLQFINPTSPNLQYNQIHQPQARQPQSQPHQPLPPQQPPQQQPHLAKSPPQISSNTSPQQQTGTRSLPFNSNSFHSPSNRPPYFPPVNIRVRKDTRKDAHEHGPPQHPPRNSPPSTHSTPPPSTEDDPTSLYSNLQQCIGNISSLARDQQGCRFLQRQIEPTDPNAKQNLAIILKEILPSIAELMIDAFGNYLSQKIIESSDEGQLLSIIRQVSPNLVAISLNLHGTRSIQRLIEHSFTSAHRQVIVDALKDNVVTLIKDLNGNHVIQRVLNHFESHEKQFIFDTVERQCLEVACHRHGCCVLQRCVDYAAQEQKMQLIRAISVNAVRLVEDPFGNYVVQYALQCDTPQTVKNLLLSKFLTHICDLAMQKFSSNVIEKCLQNAPVELRNSFINEILESGRIFELVHDAYGNYVVQKALTVANPAHLARLSEQIYPILPQIRNTPYGKRIQGKLQKPYR